MPIIIYIASAVLPVAVRYLLREVRREYDSKSTLSPTTVFRVWMLYLAHASLTIWSVWISLWLVPIDAILALVAGLVILFAGTALCMAGLVAFSSFSRMSGTKADRLITRGSYRWSRNPQNVGLGVALIGIALIGRSGFALLLAAFFWATIHIYLPMEEAFLRRIFGESFEDYRRRTPRYFGVQSE
jgi:protein-S-isoprenylcysteine O-methyltransferase Ste14